MRKYLALILLICTNLLVFAGPPKPPAGKRWVLNPDVSDEFNETKLDTSKWLDYHPTWMGREPGLFMPSQVSVKDGFLQIRGEKMDKDSIIHTAHKDYVFNTKCGAVVSKKSIFLGYYECRAKAAATTMSTTFWFSSGRNAGPKNCDEYHLEWDIQECIGREGDFKGSFFAKGMHSNSHYWYNDCDGVRHDYRAPQVRFENDELASKDFHVYGGWWRSESSASYYYDNRSPKYQKFYDGVIEKPFNKPMHMRIVSETYPFPWIKLPSDQELLDSTKNTVYYDWVRGYKLVDADEPSNLKPEQLVKIYHEGVFFDKAILNIETSKTLNIPLTYKANEDRKIRLELFSPDGTKIKDVLIPAYAGYANIVYPLALDKQLEAKAGYKLTSTLLHKNGNKKEKLDTNTLSINLKD